jgi:hypothetical protein
LKRNGEVRSERVTFENVGLCLTMLGLKEVRFENVRLSLKEVRSEGG